MKPASDYATLFPDSGLISISRGGLHILVDTGPFGPGGAGHSHSDTLSLTIRSGEQELLIDAGTYTYVADPQARDQFRGSGSHSTIRVDEQDQADPSRPFRWDNKPIVQRSEFREDSGAVYIDASCSYREIAHRRRFALFGTRVMFILDQLSGPEGEHDFEQFWLLGPCAEEFLTILSGFPFNGHRVEGWRSRCLGSKERTPTQVFRWHATFPATAATALVFGDPQAVAYRLEQQAHAGSSVRLVIPGIAAAEFPESGPSTVSVV